MRKSTHTAQYALLREFLAELRKNAGLSQRALADRLRLPHTWVSKVESGERRIDLVEFSWFCEACGSDPVASADKVFRGLSGRGGKRERKPRGRMAAR